MTSTLDPAVRVRQRLYYLSRIRRLHTAQPTHAELLRVCKRGVQSPIPHRFTLHRGPRPRVEHTLCSSTALLAVIARALVWTPFLLFVLNQKTQGRGTAWLFSSRCRLPSPSLSILACSTSCTCTATLNTDVGTEKGIIKDPCTSTAVKGGLLR